MAELLTKVRNHATIGAVPRKTLPNRVCEWACGSHMEHFKEKVRELREKMGWAQEDLARQVGVSLSTVQRWEKQGARPTRLARREIARLFREAGISEK